MRKFGLVCVYVKSIYVAIAESSFPRDSEAYCSCPLYFFSKCWFTRFYKFVTLCYFNDIFVVSLLTCWSSCSVLFNFYIFLHFTDFWYCVLASFHQNKKIYFVQFQSSKFIEVYFWLSSLVLLDNIPYTLEVYSAYLRFIFSIC